MKRRSLLIVLAWLAACAEDKDSDTAVDTDTDTDADTDADADSDADSDADTDSGPVIVTVRSFEIPVGGTGYVPTGAADLVFTVGAECESWTRSSMDNDGYPVPHDHYNAHRDSTYIDPVFTWTEYGPEHTQQDIDATCAAAGPLGAVKSVDWTGYYQDKPNVYLQIVSVTGL